MTDFHACLLMNHTGKPGEHQARVTTFSDELVKIINECAT